MEKISTIAKSNIKALLRRTLPPTMRTTPLANYVRKWRERAYWLPPNPTHGFYSQNGQDQAIVRLFGSMRNGVFLDIGAHDGMSYSNTCHLERELGWTGICIEPHPDVFARLVANRSCVCENVAVSVNPGTASFVCVSGYGEMLSGLATENTSARVAEAVRTAGAVAREVEVPCLTIAEILERHAIDHADYISLDIEGGEFDILRKIDLRGLKVRALTIEHNCNDDRIELFLRDEGFRLVCILGNDGVYQSTR